MRHPFIVPQRDLATKVVTITNWLVENGASVEEGQDVLEITTEKTVMPIQAPLTGRLEIAAQPDDELPVGGLLGYIVSAAAGATPEPIANRIQATPAVRALASRLDVDLGKVVSSGPGGLINAADVERAAQAKGAPAAATAPAAQPASEYVSRPLSGIRAAIAANLVRSLRDAAQVTANVQVDMTAVHELRQSLKGIGLPLSYNDIIARLTVRALLQHTVLNAHLTAGEIRTFRPVHLGLAVDRPEGLAVAVVRNADRMALPALSVALRDLVVRAREGRARPDELQGSTFTISNTGPYAVDAFTPVLNPPEIGLLGVGGITDRVFAVGGRPEVRLGVVLSFTYDHRVVDGVTVARFMTDLKRALEAADQDLASECRI